MIDELIKNTLSWSASKGLDKADFRKQITKLHEEFGELASGYLKNNQEVIKDSVGDILVVLTILLQQAGCSEERITKAINGFDYNGEMCEPDTVDLILQIGSVIGITSDAYKYRGLKLVEILERNTTFIATYLKRLSSYLGFEYSECFQIAWNEIKDRTGQMVNGSFVKSSDLEKGEQYGNK